MRAGLALLLALGLSACSFSRLPAPAAGEWATPVGMPPAARYLPAERGGSAATAAAFWEGLAERAAGRPVEVLAISGGGGHGAFAAGALVGLSQRGQRPVYTVVTGVSVGALIAPFAFLGAAYDGGLERLFSPATGGSLLRGTGLMTQPALRSNRRLQAMIQQFYPDDLIGAIAREGVRGRVLLVGTTDLDAGGTVIWDLTALAMLDTPASRRLFRQVLLASVSLPGLLPPVLIDVSTARGDRQEMHVDGAVRPFFVGPETELQAVQAGAAPTHVYVLMNRQLTVANRTIPRAIVPILKQALATEVGMTARALLTATGDWADRRGILFEVAGIPAGNVLPDATRLASPQLRNLFETSRQRAAEGRLWETASQAMSLQATGVLRAGND